jgi:hypothetical protein
MSNDGGRPRWPRDILADPLALANRFVGLGRGSIAPLPRIHQAPPEAASAPASTPAEVVEPEPETRVEEVYEDPCPICLQCASDSGAPFVGEQHAA